MGKRKRVPEVLWKMYGRRAKTLSETIISIIPKLCDCKARGKCLSCVFGITTSHNNANDDNNCEDHKEKVAMSYLLRPNDPKEYQQLMKNCFVVVPTHAPPLPPLIPFSLRWSQLQIVERVIEACSKRQAATSNVICSGYKSNELSPNVKLLTTSAWNLTLERVGETIMDYILLYSLIFIPVTSKGLQQVTGPPAHRQIARLPLHTAMPKSGPFFMPGRQCRKRKRGNEYVSVSDGASYNMPYENGKQNSFMFVGTSKEDDVGNCNLERSSLLNFSEADMFSTNHSSHSDYLIKERCCGKSNVTLGKRCRLASWQRRKRRKEMRIEETQEPLMKSFDVGNDLHKRDQPGFCFNSQQDDVVRTSDKINDSQDKLIPLLCPCCSVFQSLSQVPKDAQIHRKSMLYNMERSSSLFHKGHVLYSLKSGVTGAHDLLRHVFGVSSNGSLDPPASCFHNRGHSVHGPPCLYHSFIKLFKDFTHRAKRCQQSKLLKKHCFVQPPSIDKGDAISAHKGGKFDSEQGNGEVRNPLARPSCSEPKDSEKTSEVSQHHFGLPQPYCLKDEVVSFVWAVCRSIVPPELLGVASTRRKLRKSISRFVKLRRYEKFSLKQCLHKVGVSKFPLFSNKYCFECFNAFTVKRGSMQAGGPEPRTIQNMGHSALKQILLERWIFWLFAHIVVPVIQANFYVTNSEHGKQNLYYYRKSVWKKLRDKVIKELKNQNYRSLDVRSVKSILSKRSFGFSKIRLCPKESGARPIANLKAPSRLCTWVSNSQMKRVKKKGRAHKKYCKVSRFKAVNTVLRDLHVVFKYLMRKEPEKWGSSVSSYNDVYRKLCPFLRILKEGQERLPSVYIVVSDVQKAFDTINQDKLITILNELQMAENYTLKKSCEISCRKRSLWVSDKKFITRCHGPSEPNLISSARRSSCHAILVDQEHNLSVSRGEVLLILKEHLKHNVLKLGRGYVLQIVGIPQGSVLSSLLCSLYYGHLERNVIFPLLSKGSNGTIDLDSGNPDSVQASFSPPRSLLLRFVDDFLLLSTSNKQATSFFTRLRRGFREYNCYMNHDKFCSNFGVDSMPRLESKRLLVGSDGSSFLCWSGLLINSCNLEVQADYTRYLNAHLSSTVSVNWLDKPVCQLKTKLCAYMRPKCHPIFFDGTINSPATIRLNVYQAFMLCAMKFHCYVRELLHFYIVHPRSCFTCIEGSIRYMYNLMKRKMYGINGGTDCHSPLKLVKEEVMWLGLTAYVRVLNRKQTRYKDLLRLLRAALMSLASFGSSAEMKYAVDDFHSSFLWKIKF